MKPLLILLAGCAPLAVLTVWSFVELGSIEDHAVAGSAREAFASAAAEAEKMRSEVAGEKRVLEALAGAELFSTGPAGGIPSAPSHSSLRRAADAWREWLELYDLMARALEAERLASNTSVDDLQEAVRQSAALQKQCRALLAPGSAQLCELLDRRVADLQRRLKHAQQRAEAEALIGRAREAFHAEQYDQCAMLCRETLARYRAVMEPAVAEKVELLGDRAAFWSEHLRLSSQLQATDSLLERKRLLTGFLGRYGGRRASSAPERQVLQQRQGQLAAVESRLRSEEQTRRGAAAVADLDRALPADLETRLRQAAHIAARFPAEGVRALLDSRLRQWLGEYLPEKKLDEPPLLQEAETKRHEIVRGFFQTIKTAEGAIAGYKRYPTYEEMLNPQAEVGTLKPDELLAPPGPTFARRLVSQYNEARQRLLARAGEKPEWTRFAELCETLHQEWRQYRQKPGSSREMLSFDGEARRARQMLAGSGVDNFARILGGRQSDKPMESAK